MTMVKTLVVSEFTVVMSTFYAAYGPIASNIYIYTGGWWWEDFRAPQEVVIKKRKRKSEPFMRQSAYYSANCSQTQSLPCYWNKRQNRSMFTEICLSWKLFMTSAHCVMKFTRRTAGICSEESKETISFSLNLWSVWSQREHIVSQYNADVGTT